MHLMITRYKTDKNGKSVPIARIYTSKEHNVRNSHIDKDALWAVRRLQASGAQAYIVGGAVRDLLLGRTPKDFDIATSASPRQVQRLFWNSRAIGRRFRIVHIFFGSKIIEVTTFRSDEENFEEGNNNIFGTIEQDSKRRDFSINALYYNPVDGHLVDFNNSMADFKKHLIRSLIPLKYSFSEDPVRMIRAIKYMCSTGFRLKWDVKFAIRKNAPLIATSSVSRLTDEMIKIFNSGYSEKILYEMNHYRLLGYIMPCFAQYVNLESVRSSLKELDEKVMHSKEEGESAVSFAQVIFYVVKSLVIKPSDNLTQDEKSKDIFRQIKILFAPMTPPNYELERASELMLIYFGLKSGKSKARKKIQSANFIKQRREAKPNRSRRKKSGATIPKVASDVSEADSAALAHDI